MMMKIDFSFTVQALIILHFSQRILHLPLLYFFPLYQFLGGAPVFPVGVGIGGGAPHPMIFFELPPPPIKTDASSPST